MRYSRFAAFSVPLPLDYSPVHALEQSLLARLAPSTLTEEVGAPPELFLFHSPLHRARGLFLMLSSRAIYLYRQPVGGERLEPDTPSDGDDWEANEVDRLTRLLQVLRPDSAIFAVPYKNVEKLVVHAGLPQSASSPMIQALPRLASSASARHAAAPESAGFESGPAYLQFVFVDAYAVRQERAKQERAINYPYVPSEPATSSSSDKMASSSSDYSSSGEHSSAVSSSGSSPPVGSSAVSNPNEGKQLLHSSRSGRKWSAPCDSALVAQRAAREFRRVRAILDAGAHTRFGADSGLASRIEARLMASSAAIATASHASRSSQCSFYRFDSLASCYGEWVRR